MKIFFILLESLIIVYGAVAISAMLLSDRLIFPAPPSSYADGEEILKIPLENGETIATVYLPNPSASFFLLYSHGNGEDLGHLMPLLQLYHRFGLSICAYDYPGYGTSDGSPSEKGTYAAIDGVYKFLTQDQRIPPRAIVAYGRSLGGGPSIDLAAREPLGGLIIESSFVTAFRVKTRIPLLPWDKFRNLAKLTLVSCPVLIVHGVEDEIVPFWHGKALFHRAKAPKFYFWVEKANHNNLIESAGQAYWDTLKSFFQEVEKQNSKWPI